MVRAQHKTMEESHFKTSCQQCGLKELCLPHSLTNAEMDEVDRIARRGKPLHKGDALFRQGEQFDSIFAVRAGCIKVFTIDDRGDEKVVGFFLPGEILGFDAIDSGNQGTSAVALSTSSVCEIPFEEIEALSGKIKNLQTHMYRLLSREIRADQELQMLLAKNNAEERIGAFLMNLSIRYERRNLSAMKFRLEMTRSDIANYLGLAVETVSRVITRLQKSGILKVDGKSLEILNRSALCSVSHLEKTA